MNDICCNILPGMEAWHFIKVAQNSFKQFLGVIITTLYHLTLVSHGVKKLPNHWWVRWNQFYDIIGYYSNSKTR